MATNEFPYAPSVNPLVSHPRFDVTARTEPETHLTRPVSVITLSSDSDEEGPPPRYVVTPLPPSLLR